MTDLTHIDDKGRAAMVDVTAKDDTERSATAGAFIALSPATLALIAEGKAAKGDVIAAARIAGIMAAKKTSELIPLCHPLMLTGVGVEIAPREDGAGLSISATAKTRGESYELFKLRFEGGLISLLELSQNRSQYEEALATIPPIEKAIAQQENGLSVLLGRNPGPIARGKSIDELTLPAIPAGLPSELLERRPDLRRAEQELIAANALIGAAKAAYFPTISLTGLFGYSSTSLSNLFQGENKVWNYGLPISMPIFTAGALAGQLQSAEATQQQALFSYQKAIQEAFREVNDALINQDRTREQLHAQRRQVEALQQYAATARLRYDNGYTSFIEVLDAERSLFSVQLQYTQTQGTEFQAMISLYLAMGGGWVNEADRLAGKADDVAVARQP